MNQNFVFYQISCPCPIAYCYYSIPGSCLTALPAGGGTLLLSLSLCLLLYLVPVSQRCLLVVVHSSCPCPLPTTIPGSCLTALPAGGRTLLLSLSLLLLYLVPVSQRCLLVVVHSSLGVVSHSSLERERDTIPVF